MKLESKNTGSDSLQKRCDTCHVYLNGYGRTERKRGGGGESERAKYRGRINCGKTNKDQ